MHLAGEFILSVCACRPVCCPDFLPIELLAMQGTTEIAAALLGSPGGAATVNIASPFSLSMVEAGFTPLHLSVYLNDPRLVILLLKAGADAMLRTARGRTPLLLAVEQESEMIVELLLEDAGGAATINTPGIEQRFTPLLAAARFGNTQLVRMLLKHGADVTLSLADGSTARQLASRHGHKDVVSLLTRAEASAEASMGELSIFVFSACKA
jgi:ankyrin repeat protein